MALQSQLFRGDPKLEAAAVSDPAHILPGASGPHVGKIQLALIKLDRAFIAQDEAQGLTNGPSTAGAVLAYKRKRNIVNRSYQTQADNIVGKMTMASLDGEMLRIETLPSASPGIVPLLPTPLLVFRETAIVSPRAFSRSRLSLGPDAPPPPQIIPGGPTLQMQIPVNGIGTFQVVNGVGETASCDDSSIGSVFDPADPRVQGAVFVERSPHLCNVRGLKAGPTSIHVTRSNAQGIPIGFVRLPLVVGAPPPTGSFVSLNGTPVNPKGNGRMINIFGESTDKTPGFDNFTTDPKFTKGNDGVDRPFTNDPKKPPGIVDHKASDICLRDSPINTVTLDEMARIAMPGCRLTIALNSGPGDGIPGGTDQQLKRVRDKFVPAGIVLQEGPHNEISNNTGKPMVRKVLVIDMV